MRVASSNTGLPQTREACRSESGAVLRELIAARNQELQSHRYFELCQSGRISRAQLLEVLKQLYCFSAFYEQLLQGTTPPPSEFGALCPKTFTKAMFGYLSVALQGEHSKILSIAVIRVMESVAEKLFRETLRAAVTHNALTGAAPELMSLNALRSPVCDPFDICDEEAFTTCRQLINDLYRLLDFVLDEWIGIDSRAPTLASQERAIKALRLN